MVEQCVLIISAVEVQKRGNRVAAYRTYVLRCENTGGNFRIIG